ncbi:MAG: A24 family peptidase [Phycisphaerae bacterium]|nr:A24 family peptidase [Phycisphaerae bacterium]
MWRWIAQKWFLWALAVVLVAAAVSDLRSGKIYNCVTYPAVLVGLVGHWLWGGVDFQGQRIGLADAVIGLVVGFVPLFLAWRAGGIGGGDAKLMAAVGALTGWEFTLSSMFYGFLIAGVMAVATMVRYRITLRTLGRVWRFLMLAITPGKVDGPADPAGADSPKIAFGLALCIGAAIELIDVCLDGPLTGRLFQ